ncbi:MAG: UDP-N-acetylmuramate dehydrogenase [Acidobacteriota bacterium]|nr:UDP-N-acetylmuramate dehydrogenase [Acidobacteriota bacterium]
MQFRSDEPLKPFTTFKIGGPARYFARLSSPQEIPKALQFASSHQLPVFVLGGGSNLLVSDRGLDALVIHPVNEGVILAGERKGCVLIRAAAGEPWDRVVAFAARNNWWGIENLSHIPGQAGAALVQNIGAYGQQLSDVLESAEIADLADGSLNALTREECGLGYRQSIFNGSHKARFLILSITLCLSLTPRPRLDYPDVKSWFGAKNNIEPSIGEIREAITAIRDRKFPYPRVEKGGNAGSFFKNLTLTPEEYEELERCVGSNFGAVACSRLREFRSRGGPANNIRIPTAFLMDLCGLKGAEFGGAKVNETQPLVLLNQGGATARDVLTLARHVRQTLFRKTGMKVAIEPELAGFTKEEIGAFDMIFYT